MSTVRFAYTIIYVPDVVATLDFYEQALGLQRRFVSDDGSYGELDTGVVTLSFASESLADHNLPDGYQPLRPTDKPAAFEVAFSTDDVAAMVDRAVAAGAALVTPPAQKPWGQTVAHVRDLNGVLIEICTPMGD
jgi:catechol 2,3-dioxygenase-like lactoylglutathione lyase family enzyme